jgi:hypothetical protein
MRLVQVGDLDPEAMHVMNYTGAFDLILQTIQKCSHEGEKLLSNGVRLICPTRDVAPEAWLHVLYPPLKIKELEELEKRLMIPIPEDFKQFLLQANGATLFSY